MNLIRMNQRQAWKDKERRRLRLEQEEQYKRKVYSVDNFFRLLLEHRLNEKRASSDANDKK